jgi:hypothetical protein
MSAKRLTAGWSPWTWLVLYVLLVYASSPFALALARALGASAAGRVLLTVVPLLAVVALVSSQSGLGRVAGVESRSPHG